MPDKVEPLLNGKNDGPARTRWLLTLLSVVVVGLVFVGGYRVYREKLFTLSAHDGRSLCRVEVGWTQQGVVTHCGLPTGRGMQPKVPASGFGFFNLQMCSAPGDVYGDKVVLYECDGTVASVEHMPAKGFLEDR